MPLPSEPMTYSYLDMCSNFIGKSKTFLLCFAGVSLFLCIFETSFFSILKFTCFLGSIFTLKILTFFSKSILERIRKCYTDYPFFYDIFSHKNLSSFDLKHVFLKLIFNLSYIISIEVHHKMNRRCDVAMSWTLQKEECAKLLNI